MAPGSPPGWRSVSARDCPYAATVCSTSAWTASPRWARSAPGLVAFLRSLVRMKANVIVTGRPNAGKTTLIRAMAGEAPSTEKLVVIEKDYELALDRLGRHRQ